MRTQAPRLQPDATEQETPAAQAQGMRRSEEMEQGVVAPEPVEALPERTWRAVGWIFRDGACVAIERHGSGIRTRVPVE